MGQRKLVVWGTPSSWSGTEEGPSLRSWSGVGKGKFIVDDRESFWSDAGKVMVWSC